MRLGAFFIAYPAELRKLFEMNCKQSLVATTNPCNMKNASVSINFTLIFTKIGVIP